MSNLNFAQNQNILFMSVDMDFLNPDVLDEINDNLWTEYNKRLGIMPVSDEEQAEIKTILDNMSEDDKQIVETHLIHVKGDKYEVISKNFI